MGICHTPSHPEGLRTSDLPTAFLAHQVETVRHWFQINYQPLGEGPWFAWDTPGAGWDQDKWAPDGTITPDDALSDEFGDAVPDVLRSGVASEFRAQSGFWVPIPDLVKSIILDPPAATMADLAALKAEMDARFDRLERLRKFEADARHGVGGNQGPALNDLAHPIQRIEDCLAL